MEIAPLFQTRIQQAQWIEREARQTYDAAIDEAYLAREQIRRAEALLNRLDELRRRRSSRP